MHSNTDGKEHRRMTSDLIQQAIDEFRRECPFLDVPYAILVTENGRNELLESFDMDISEPSLSVLQFTGIAVHIDETVPEGKYVNLTKEAFHNWVKGGCCIFPERKLDAIQRRDNKDAQEQDED